MWRQSDPVRYPKKFVLHGNGYRTRIEMPRRYVLPEGQGKFS